MLYPENTPRDQHSWNKKSIRTNGMLLLFVLNVLIVLNVFLNASHYLKQNGPQNKSSHTQTLQSDGVLAIGVKKDTNSATAPHLI